MRCSRLGGAFWRVLVLYVLGATAYSLLLPLGEAPDEPGHYNYARIVAAEQRRPRGDEEHEAFQPPLYYWLASPLAALGDVSALPLKGNADFELGSGPGNLLVHDSQERFPYAGWAVGWHLVRLLSVALGALTVYGVYRFGYVVGRGSEAVAGVATTLFVLAPQFLLLQGVASNDVLALSLGTLLLVEAAVLAAGPVPRRRVVAAGLLWGLATLAKSSMLALGAALAVALLLAQRGVSPARALVAALRHFLIAAAAAAAVCGWWFAQNVIEYGDPLAWQLIYAINAARTDAVNWLAQAWGVHRSYWLGYVAMRLPTWLYVLLLVPGAVAACGLAAAALRRSLSWRVAPALIALVQAGAFALAWGRWTLAVQGTDQARLLYAAFAALAALAAVGVVCAAGSSQAPRLALALALSLNVYALAAGVLPVFRPAERVALADVPGGGEPVEFGGRLRLLSWRLPQSVAASEVLPVSTWWSLVAPEDEDIWLTLRLRAADGSVPVWKRGTPSAGRDTTDRWPLGMAVVGEHRLALPADLVPGTYIVEVGLQVFGSDAWLPATSGESGHADVWPLGTVEVTAPGG